MPARMEMLGDGALGGETPLRVPRGLEPLHAPLPLASRLVRISCPVVEIAMLALFHPREYLPLGSPRAFELIRDDHSGHIDQSTARRRAVC